MTPEEIDRWLAEKAKRSDSLAHTPPSADEARAMAERGATGPTEADADRWLAERGLIDLNVEHTPASVSPGRAAFLGVTQGASAGFGEEIGAGVLSQTEAARRGREPVLGPAMAPSPDDTTEQRAIKEQAAQRAMATLGPGHPLSYQGIRDRSREELDRAASEQSEAYTGGELAGGLATAFLPGGAPRGALGALGAGALFGGVAGMGASRGDLTSDDPEQRAQVARDTGRGMGLGTLAGAGGVGVAKLAPAAVRLTGSALRKAGVNLGRKQLLSGTRTLGPNLRELPDAAVEEAYKVGAILPGGTVKGSAVRLERAAEQVGARYGEILEELERAGVRGPRAHELARRFAQRSAEEFKTSDANKAVSNLFKREGRNVEAVADTTVTPVGPGVVRRRQDLGLLQAEQIKRKVQAQARYGRYEDTPKNEAMKEIGSIYREAIEDSVDDARKGFLRNSPEDMAAEDFVPIKQRFGRLADARDAAVQGARASANRGALGLSEKNAIMQGAATMDPVALAKAVGGATLMRGALNRGLSTVGAPSYWAGRGLQSLGGRAGLVPEATRMRIGTGAAGLLERALANDPTLTDEERAQAAMIQALLAQPSP